MLTVIGGTLVYNYNVDNLKWIRKAIMERISLDIWESTEKDLGIKANGPATSAAVISKIQQVRLSVICNFVNELSKMYLIN